MSFINDSNATDGKSAERVVYREECKKQWLSLPKASQDLIERNPLCREANLFYEGVEREIERQKAATVPRPPASN